MTKLSIVFFEEAENFIKTLPETDSAKIMANIKTMTVNIGSVNTRLLKSPIRELKVKKYRLLFFMKKNIIYIVSGFIKKSQKAPIQEIQNAKKISKQYINTK